ncbi:MAG: hypothetical protein ACREE7_13760 [Dongiaceae bacterium]
MIMEITYTLYLTISIGITVWVARSLSRNGRVFLVDSFGGHEALADSVNHLLVVGFYFINIGYVTLALRYGDHPADAAGGIEYLNSKVGLVLVVIGVMHFFNIWVITRLRRRAAYYERKATATGGAVAATGAA